MVIANRYFLLDAASRGGYSGWSSLICEEWFGLYTGESAGDCRQGNSGRRLVRLGFQSYTGGRLCHGTFKERCFFQNEPKLKKRNQFAMRVLCKTRLGFARRSEPKFKGGEVLEEPKTSRNVVFWHGTKPSCGTVWLPRMIAASRHVKHGKLCRARFGVSYREGRP